MIYLLLFFSILSIFLLVSLLRRSPQNKFAQLEENVQRMEERTERAVREEIAKNREEMSNIARRDREEAAIQAKGFNDSVLKQLSALAGINEQKLENMRKTIEERLNHLQNESSQKLELMRATVDEKLHATLEKRLGESFRLVSERLEQVYKGLGEMHNLAQGVGDLKKVLSNVKTRGTWGEIQLGSLLEQMLSKEQYAANVATGKDNYERVEFAVKLPGREEHKAVWLPIDAKFPLEVYQRLVDAQEKGDVQAVKDLEAALEDSIEVQAKKIRDKYVNPPQTTDFAIMFLPVEGLYAEVLRRPGLCEILQRKYRISVTGPTTITALLNSLQMGFTTLAVEKRASEVWQILGAVKVDFGRFGDLLDKTHKKLQEASHTIEDATRKTRTIERKLRNVQELPVLDDAKLIAEASEVTVGAGEITEEINGISRYS
ncbi:MAG: DNA recombination protein RmuC [Candidatus Omnitrophota bacterium]